jgi:hypothetical protein
MRPPPGKFLLKDTPSKAGDKLANPLIVDSIYTRTTKAEASHEEGRRHEAEE